LLIISWILGRKNHLSICTVDVKDTTVCLCFCKSCVRPCTLNSRFLRVTLFITRCTSRDQTLCITQTLASSPSQLVITTICHGHRLSPRCDPVTYFGSWILTYLSHQYSVTGHVTRSVVLSHCHTDSNQLWHHHHFRLSLCLGLVPVPSHNIMTLLLS